MSVFTQVDPAGLERWLAGSDAGRLLRHEGLPGGVENTNYRVDTDRGAWVLTLYEWQSEAQVSARLALSARLAAAGLPVAAPRHTGALMGKPAALVSWLEGRHLRRVQAPHCAAIGGFLAAMHHAARDFEPPLDDPRDDDWRTQCREALDDHLKPAAARLMDEAMTDASALPELPSGVIHADLFRDNALFSGGRLTGVIDFQYACRGPLAYDVAVTAIDWCRAKTGLDHRLLKALCDGYAAVRTPTTLERIQFPRLLALAALRFWISRTYDAQFPREGLDVERKDPRVMARLLKSLRNRPVGWA